jgi:hypothetical protein
MDKNTEKKSYLDYLPEDGGFNEDDLWNAIASANDLDYEDIADGDLVDWL